MKHQWGRQQGVSLIEAVVAMAIMGFGMLGVLGMQSALRSNADISKQRSEAVRIAQAAIETRRSFSVLAATAGARDYDTIATVLFADIAGDNASFRFTPTVTTFPAVGDELTVAPHKRLVVDVTWLDRNNVEQSVHMGTIISATAPEVSAALSTPGDASAVQSPGGRNPAVPPSAVDLGNGTSRFAPPGAATGVTWTFNNINGFITHTCLSVCTPFDGRLLSGFVNFAAGTPGSPAPRPTSADSESPPPNFLLGTGGEQVIVSVPITSPTNGTVPCFHQPTATYIAYFCAMPVTLAGDWSGQARLTLPTGRALAGSISDHNDNKYRVCRYTIAAARVIPHLVVPTLPYTVPPPIRNENHPLHYVQVTSSLIGQNFLVIRAGNNSFATRLFDCPADSTNPITPEIDGTTWHHQPDL